MAHDVGRTYQLELRRPIQPKTDSIGALRHSDEQSHRCSYRMTQRGKNLNTLLVRGREPPFTALIETIWRTLMGYTYLLHGLWQRHTHPKNTIVERVNGNPK